MLSRELSRSPAEQQALEESWSPFTRDVLSGLSEQSKWIPAKYLYDREGAELFEELCALEEYYLCRAEQEVLQKYLPEIADWVGPDALVIEPGSGNSVKVRPLLRGLKHPAGYVAIEITLGTLLRATSNIQLEFPHLLVGPVQADFWNGMTLPGSLPKKNFGRRLAFLPGAMIGSFHRDEVPAFLRMLHHVVGNDGALLIGVDLKKDPAMLQRAYDDQDGVTAEFNLHLLRRMNRELHANFQLANFAHLAVYNEVEGRVEMHLESLIPQIVSVAGESFRFRQGETIHTENAYKYTVDEFTVLAAQARFAQRRVWLDAGARYAVYLFHARL